MEASRIIGGLAFTCAFFAAFCLGSAALNAASNIFKHDRALKTTGTSNAVFGSCLRNGIKPLIPLGLLFLKLNFFKRICENVERVCSYKDIECSPKSLSSLFCLMSFLLLMISILVCSSLIFGIAGIICLILGMDAWVKHEEEKRREELRSQIPEALQSMKVCFCVGYSLHQTLNQVAEETEGVLSQIFKQANDVLESGGTISQALDFIKQQSAESELLFVATALEIQHKTGSSMQQVLDVARESVADELELKRTLKTQTAQAKLSAQIVTLMPFLLIGLFSLISPGFLDPFFESFIGLVMFIGALFMQLVGILLVRKMLHVEVA